MWTVDHAMNMRAIFALISMWTAIYVNCGSCNEYKSNLCSNENYWSPSSSELKGLEGLYCGQIKASIKMAWYYIKNDKEKDREWQF